MTKGEMYEPDKFVDKTFYQNRMENGEAANTGGSD